MKKEDLCMLLLVVALLLVVSRSTNIFEGVDETLGVPDVADIFGIGEGQGGELDLINEDLRLEEMSVSAFKDPSTGSNPIKLTDKDFLQLYKDAYNGKL